MSAGLRLAFLLSPLWLRLCRPGLRLALLLSTLWLRLLLRRPGLRLPLLLSTLRLLLLLRLLACGWCSCRGCSGLAFSFWSSAMAQIPASRDKMAILANPTISIRFML